MIYKILEWKNAYRSSIIYTPTIMMLLFTVVALGIILIDYIGLLKGILGDIAWFTATSAKNILSVIATSVITVISVVFSISVLTLSIAANQLGPRLIPNFIKSGQTQFVLGIFIGTFVYSMVILFAVDYLNSTLLFSVMIAVLLSFISIIVLIKFIHFICQHIQVEFILDQIMGDLKTTVNREFMDHEQPITPKIDNIDKLFHGKKEFKFSNKKPGYIQTINYFAIAKFASQNGLIIKILYKSGEYVLSNFPIMLLYSDKSIKDELIEECASYVKIGNTRTSIQDIEFMFEQMSEIAIHALSPAINNPYTAMLCINYVSEGIQFMSQYREPPASFSVDDKVCLVICETNYESVINKTLNRLRQQATEDLSVTIKLIEMITNICENQTNYKVIKLLKEQAGHIYNDCQLNLKNNSDKVDLEAKYNKIS